MSKEFFHPKPKEIEDQLRVDLPADIFDQILKVDKKREESELEKAGDRQKKKYMNLRERIVPSQENNREQEERTAQIISIEEVNQNEIDNILEKTDNLLTSEQNPVRRSTRTRREINYKEIPRLS